MENLAGILPTYKFLVSILLKEFAPSMIHDHYIVNENMSITVYGTKRNWLSNWLGRTKTYSLIDVLKQLTQAVAKSGRIDAITARRIEREVTDLFMDKTTDTMPLLRELLAIAIGIETYSDRVKPEPLRMSRRESTERYRFPSGPIALNWTDLDDKVWDKKWRIETPLRGKSTISVEQQVIDEDGHNLGTQVQDIEFEDYLDKRYNKGQSTSQLDRGKF